MKRMTDENRPQRKTEGGSGLPVRSRTGLASVFEELFRPFDELFEPIFPMGGKLQLPELEGFSQPILDVQDRGDHYGVTAELPGFSKDEVEVKVNGNGLELRAQRSEKGGEDEKGVATSRSRSYYQYLSLPEGVASEKIEGTMKNGVLELKVPKRASKLKDSARRVDLK